MDLIRFAVLVVVLVAVCAIVAWFVRRSGLVIPQPLLIVIYAVVAIVAILLIAQLVGVGPAVLR